MPKITIQGSFGVSTGRIVITCEANNTIDTRTGTVTVSVKGAWQMVMKSNTGQILWYQI